MPVTLLKSCPNAMDQEEMYYKEKKILFFFDSHLFFYWSPCAHTPSEMCKIQLFFIIILIFFYHK